VNLYNSPILIEVDGVEGHLRVKSKPERAAHTDHDRKRKRHGFSSAGIGRRSHGGQQGVDVAEYSEFEPAIPTTIDLVQSFLQAEPEEEKEKLEAALLSETQTVNQSSSFIDDDEEFPTGTGAPIPVPVFLTSFLQGIVDRLQVRIHGITINLELDISSDTPRSPVSNTPDSVTVQLRVEDVDIEGVTFDTDSTVNPDENVKAKSREGKRLISLAKIRGSLISEANLFSGLSRSNTTSSPSVAHSEASEGFKSMHRSTSTRDGYPQNDGASLEGDLGSSSSVLSSPLSRESSNPQPLAKSVVASEAGRFDDASEQGSNMSDSLRDSLSDSVFQNSAYLDQMQESQYLEEDVGHRQSFHLNQHLPTGSFGSPMSTPRASMTLDPLNKRDPNTTNTSIIQSTVNSTLLPTRPRSRFSEARVSQSQSSLPVTGALSGGPVAHDVSSETGSGNESSDEDAEEEFPIPVLEEDLTQSQLFSHEDAESMYMSAVSHTSDVGAMPGGWGGSHDGVDDHSLERASPIILQSRDSLDNLEHAKQQPPEIAFLTQQHSGHSPASIDDSVRTARMTSSQPTLTQQHRAPSLPHVSSGTSEHSTTSSDEYTRLTKEILDLDKIDIYLPGLNKTKFQDPSDALARQSTSSGYDDLSQSASQILPGAFSIHLPRTNPDNFKSPSPLTAGNLPTSDSDPDSRIEISIGKLWTHFDISVARLLFMIVRQLKEAQNLEPPAVSKTTAEARKPSLEENNLNIKLDFENIALIFVERLEGVLSPAQTSVEAVGPRWPPKSDTLLQANIRGLKLHFKSSSAHSQTALSVAKFNFGYANESIATFDAGLTMHSSVRDLKATEGIDVRLDIKRTGNVTRCEMTTLPMHISIDLQRLDEIFSWFGGLSSVLNLGNSIASNTTITAASPGKPKPRGVRFDTPITPDDKSISSQNKLDIRFGGFAVDLLGTDCSVGIATSSVKVVYRDEGVGLQIQAIRLTGPHLRRSTREPAITTDLTSTRLEFASSPRHGDLDRLLALITPSNSQYDNDDDIMIDTLLRQRRQGSVLKLSIDNCQVRMSNLDDLSYLPELGEEFSRLATVAKYLPDDDRPGLLSLISVHKFGADVDFQNDIGSIQITSLENEIAQITFPSLVALSVKDVRARRNKTEELIGPATDSELREPSERAPAIMARMIGEEMEPVVRIKLWNLRFEYSVPTLMTLMGLTQQASPGDMSASIVASVATLTNFARENVPSHPRLSSTTSSQPSKPLAVNMVIRDSIFGLNPLGLPSKLLLVLTEAKINAVLPKNEQTSASIDLDRGFLLVVDNVAHLVSEEPTSRPRRQSFDGTGNQAADLCAMGYVIVGRIRAAKTSILVLKDDDGERSVDVELRGLFFVLESCADSTQTLIAILSALAPPTVPSKETKYRTKPIAVQDLLASLSGDAFGGAEGEYNIEDDFDLGALEDLEEEADDLDFDPQFYQQEPDNHFDQDVIAGMAASLSSTNLSSRDTNDGVLLDSFTDLNEPETAAEIQFDDNHFGPGTVLEGSAHRWNSAKDTYDRSNVTKVERSPFKVCVRDVHVQWNLFDGYDWQGTRDVITKAVHDVESKAMKKRARNERRSTFDRDLDDDDEEDLVIGDFLFNSIYIGIPAKTDPRDLTAAINQDFLNDTATETESIATTTTSSTSSRPSRSKQPKSKTLRLNRSKRNKMTFELKGVNVDLVTFPESSGETQNSIDIRVKDLDVIDCIPSSTWKSFASYMHEAGEREMGSSMVHIEVLNVKPVTGLAASELVLKVTILPLRLHVDQDALDFITRFFEFKDDTAPTRPPSPGDVPFIQRAEINNIVVRLDFKPKHVDYAGLRAGHTTELMNFAILDQADMVLRHTILYGVSGFERLGKDLNNIWMPDIKRNQLDTILKGLVLVQPVANLAGGIKQLITGPIDEYRKDGRIIRSIARGATKIGKSTVTGGVKLGAKAFVGLHTVLQGTEGFLGPTTERKVYAGDDGDSDEDQKKISPYANQPYGVAQGVQSGISGLQRDLLMARDAYIGIGSESMESSSAAGVYNAVRRHGPTLVLRPPIALTRFAGQILMGATNSLDPANLQRADAVSFPFLYSDNHMLIYSYRNIRSINEFMIYYCCIVSECCLFPPFSIRDWSHSRRIYTHTCIDHSYFLGPGVAFWYE
jgi:autophagy-related protein 2